MPSARLPRLVTLALVSVVTASSAQLQPVTVPKGVFRLDLGGRFETWDTRWLDGTKQGAGGDFTSNPLGASFLSTIGAEQAELRRITGVQGITLSLGRSASSILVNVSTGGIGAAYGITRRLTLFGMVPWVRVRVQNTFGIDTTTANAGFNPAHPLFGDGSGSETALFLGQLDLALGTLSENLTNGVYDADPPAKALAQQTLGTGAALLEDLEGLFLNATFLPREGTAGAEALTDPIEALRATLTTLQIAGFTASPVFPIGPVESEAFEDFATNQDGPIAGLPFATPILQYIGDVEVGAAYTLLDRAAPARGLAIRSTLVGTVRLRTGRLDRPAHFFDLPTGDRQPDVQGDLITDVMGKSFGARLSARYVLQLAGRLNKRLAPPDQPIAPADRLAALSRDPGEIIEFGIEPYLRMAPTLALGGGVHHWSKAADTYTYVLNQPPIEGTTPDVLAIGTKENGTRINAFLSFAHDGRRKDGTVGMPMDASIRWEKVIGSSLGRVPAKNSIVAQLRLYKKIF